MRSAISPTTARSCVMNSTDIWRRRCSSRIRSSIGSWKIIEMSAPRSFCSLRIDMPTRLRPPYMIWLLRSTIEFSGGNRPRIASDVTLLPDPDSPTSATVLLRGMSNEIFLTASNVCVLSRRNLIDRSRTLTSGSWLVSVAFMSMSRLSLQFRIERITQRVGEEAERRHQRGHRHRGRDQLPPLAEDQLVLCLVEHRAP